MTQGDPTQMDPAAKAEVSSFMTQVLDRTFVLEADRVRFEADEQEIFLRFYAKRDLLKSSHLKSGAFEVVWKWLMHEAFTSFLNNEREHSSFKASLPYNNGRVYFLVQRSKTLRQKTSMLLSNFVKCKPGEVYKDPDEKSKPKTYETSELRQLQMLAERDSQALPKPHFYKNEKALGEPNAQPVILIVEDQDDQRILMKKALERANYRVQEARNGEEALRLIRVSAPDLVITDLMMPKVDGSELLKRIRSEEKLKTLPVMVFTAISDPAVEFDILDMGADDYCEKTASPKIFLKRLENLIQKAARAEKAQ